MLPLEGYIRYFQGDYHMAASTTQPPRFTVVTYLLNALVYRIVMLALILYSAGRWDWFWAWLCMGIFYFFDVLSIVLVDPSLLVERKRRSDDQKAWDRLLVGLAVVVLPFVIGAVAGLNERFGWQPEMPLAMYWIAAAAIALGYGIVVWAMRVNAFFSAVVRIQTDRGHQVATGGPYRIVRHPGYVGGIVFTLATPLMLGSVWALIPALVASALYVVRTRKEDDTLQAELAGYREFAQQTRFRLIPGLW
jgi:protein-S-isoprenylcysteine O-methyltransferase Ste14